MNADLLDLWSHLNREHFEGTLTPLADVDWAPLSGVDGVEAFGVYFPVSNAMAIDERFKPNKEAIRAGDKTKEAKLEVAYRLMLHEMVHQAQHQRERPRPGGHGGSFVEIATPIAQQLAIEPPTEATAGRWPELAPLLSSFGL